MFGRIRRFVICVYLYPAIASKECFCAFKLIVVTGVFELLADFIQSGLESLALILAVVALQILHMVGGLVGEVLSLPAFGNKMSKFTTILTVYISSAHGFTNFYPVCGMRMAFVSRLASVKGFTRLGVWEITGGE